MKPSMGLDGGIHAANGPATGKDTAPDSFLLAVLKCLGHRFARLGVAGCGVEILHTDQRDWSSPAHRRGTLGGMDAATELTGTYLQRVLRWWAGKDPAANTKTLKARCITR
ncbi:hypothetical protein [Xanthomonas axonopodis]